ncbi:hypothetical protein RJ639_037246 [Escallonia herrerae]|uniref:Reverse transcriptase/retrotransposon-derived protein RNase H-like domain-containing protein n=1 Tax=Escallonia herrerae TaxID=1293975 RepID=A0AA88WN80_9ASTE|nr:hypothetical protein RJ639_037246 [Escallonia herrerae]
MSALLDKANKYIQAEEYLKTHKEHRGDNGQEQENRAREDSPKGGRGSKRSKRDEKHPKEMLYMRNLTPLTARPSQILHEIKDKQILEKPDKMRKIQGSSILSLEESPQEARPGRDEKLTQEKSSQLTPHDDPLVVTLRVGNFDMKRILVDNGSSAEVLFYETFQKMNIPPDRLRKIYTALYGLSNHPVVCEGIIALPVTMGAAPSTQAKLMLDFVVVRVLSAYNAILGRTTLNQLRAVVSTYHMKMKFPTENGVGEVKGDQVVSRQCYMASCRNRANETLMIEDLRDETKVERGKPAEDLIDIELYPRNQEKTVRVGTGLSDDLKLKLVDLLRSYSDIFTWTASEMARIDPERGIEADPEKIGAIHAMKLPKTIKQIQELTGRMAALGRFMSKSAKKCLPFFKAIRKAKDFKWTEECQKSFEELKHYLSSPPLLTKPVTGEDLFLYLSISEVAVSTFLIWEEEGKQRPVYYISKVLQDVETRYPRIDKVALALVISARKLRPYFQSHTVIMLTNQPLGKVLQNPDASGRLVNWSVELGEFDIKYKSCTAIKTQALSDFVVECTIPDDISQLILSEVSDPWLLYVDGSSKIGTARFALVDRVLYKKSFSLSYPQCLSPKEADYALQEVREGPFPMATGQQHFMIVAIDYFTKWTEAEALATITASKCEEFFWKNGVYRFRVPKVLITDNGSSSIILTFEASVKVSLLVSVLRRSLIPNLMDKQRT